MTKPTAKQIKQQADEINSIIATLKSQQEGYELNAREMGKMISHQYEKLAILQQKCKPHTFEGKPSGMMGRGICEICGENDY